MFMLIYTLDHVYSYNKHENYFPDDIPMFRATAERKGNIAKFSINVCRKTSESWYLREPIGKELSDQLRKR
jgi:hypothetical protein